MGTPSEWHRELLTASALDVPEVRAAVISSGVSADLQRLLAFRHFFRHAYAVALDPAQLDAMRQVAQRVAPPLDADLDRLDHLLADLARAT